MGYYVRLLTPSTKRLGLPALRAALEEAERPDITLAPEDADDDEESWIGFLAYSEAGEPICFVTRDVVGEGDLASGELEDFAEELAEVLPKSGAAWVKEYLGTVKVIYAAQFMSGAFTVSGAGVPGLLLSLMQAQVGGIMQADGEGFSNEEGALVVCQFADDTERAWTAAVWDDTANAWRTFQLELENPAHRTAFEEGRVPDGVELLD